MKTRHYILIAALCIASSASASQTPAPFVIPAACTPPTQPSCERIPTVIPRWFYFNLLLRGCWFS